MCGTKQAGIIARTLKTMIRTFWLGYGKICETNESAVAAHGDYLPVAVKTVHLTVPQHRFIRFLFNEKIRTFRFGYGKNGDPDENRTRVTAVKGRCLSRLTTGPYW